MTNTGSTPPGWYPAPGDPDGTQRYWDGSQWIGEPQPVPRPQAPPPPVAPPPPSAASSTPNSAPPGYVAFGGPGAVQSGQPSGLAEPLQRIVARLVDGIIWIVIGLVVGVAFGGGAVATESDGGYFVGLLASLVGLALVVAYEVLLTTKTGNTLGKKIFNTKIVNIDGSAVDEQTMIRRMSPYIGLSLLSALIPVLGALLSFFGILAISIVSIVFLFTDSVRQAVWDKIATTKVVVD